MKINNVNYNNNKLILNFHIEINQNYDQENQI